MYEYIHQGASVAECTNDKISDGWFDGNTDQRFVIWFFRDPNNNCQWKYHDRYTTNGVSELKPKLEQTMLNLIGASAACTGATATLVTTQATSPPSDTTTTTTPPSKPTSDGRCPIVIDTRSQLEWDEGHAPCAHRLEIQDDPKLVAKVLTLANGDLSYPVQLYCRSGNRSGKAQKIMQEQKWTHVTNAGGWKSGQAEAIKKLCDCKTSTNTGKSTSAPATASTQTAKATTVQPKTTGTKVKTTKFKMASMLQIPTWEQHLHASITISYDSHC